MEDEEACRVIGGDEINEVSLTAIEYSTIEVAIASIAASIVLHFEIDYYHKHDGEA